MSQRRSILVSSSVVVSSGIVAGLSVFFLATGRSARDGLLTPRPQEFVYDFGSVAAGHIITHGFTLTNGFNDSVEIKRIEPSCSCTVASSGKRLLGPHESTEVSVTLDTKGLRGHFGKGCRVLYCCRGLDYITSITLKGTIVSDPRVVPSHLDFGTIEIGTTVQKVIEVTGFRQDFTVLRVDNSRDLDVQCSRVCETPLPRYHIRVALTVDSTAGHGRTEYSVRLTTNDGTRPIIEVPVYARCLPAIRFEPTSLFSAVWFGEPHGSRKS